MKIDKSKGFTLIECIIAMLITVVCFSAIYALLTISVRMEKVSRELSLATSQARLKMEELKISVRNPGGSLATNVNNYYDQPSSLYTRRWTISADLTGAQTVSVSMIPNASGSAYPAVNLVTRMK